MSIFVVPDNLQCCVLAVHLTETIYPLYKVELNYEYPYDVIELLPFLCIGYVPWQAQTLIKYSTVFAFQLLCDVIYFLQFNVILRCHFYLLQINTVCLNTLSQLHWKFKFHFDMAVWLGAYTVCGRMEGLYVTELGYSILKMSLHVCLMFQYKFQGSRWWGMQLCVFSSVRFIYTSK